MRAEHRGTELRSIHFFALLVAVLVFAALSLTFVVSARATTGAYKVAKVQLRSTNLGRILVDNAGFTLYAFTKDSRARDNCIHLTGCPGIWPALTSSSTPVAGSGVNRSLLSTIKLGSGKHQVAYNGHPLYRYAFDSAPVQTFYVGASQFGGSWYAMNASGRYVK